MNREERRKKRVRKERVYTLKESDIQAIKDKAVYDAIDLSFLLMLCIPVSVIHDSFGKIIKKREGDKSREERFTDLCLDVYEQVINDEIGLEDLKKRLEEETGIKLEGRSI